MIRGIYAAAVTPRREGTNEVDLGAALELIGFLSASGVSGIVLMGATGEFAGFDLEERTHLTGMAVKRSRVPIIAGVSHPFLDGAVTLGRRAVEAGAAALLVAPPYFIPRSQETIRDFYLDFAEELEDAAPILIYNIPSCTSPIAPETAGDLLATGLFAGIKDSSGSWEYMQELLGVRERLGITLLAGDDTLYARARAAGADGGISGTACAVPELMLAIERAVTAGAREALDRLESRLREFSERARLLPSPAAIKEAVAARGFKVGPAPAPRNPEARERLAGFRGWFPAWLAEVKRECAAIYENRGDKLKP